MRWATKDDGWSGDDWTEALSAALRDGLADIAWGYKGSREPFTANDIAKTIAADAGENDERSWIALVRLKDKRFVFISAWCDYTGWDCQSGGSYVFADTLDDAVRFAMGDEDRRRLGLELRGKP